jgi:hypothetical protein
MITSCIPKFKQRKRKKQKTKREKNSIYALRERKTLTPQIFMRITIFQRRYTEIISQITVELGYDVTKVTEYMLPHK